MMNTQTVTGAQERLSVFDYLQRDTFFMCNPDASFCFSEDSKALPREEFEKRVIMGTYYKVQDAFILYCVNRFGHATIQMIKEWLDLYAKLETEKDVPTFTEHKALKDRLKHLCKNGLLACHIFISQGRPIDVYMCTVCGHKYFINQLGIYSAYDQNAIQRDMYEVAKRISTNSVALAFSRIKSCENVWFNEHLKTGDKETPYLYAAAQTKEGNRSVYYLIEPAYFIHDKRRLSEDDIKEKIQRRFSQLKQAKDILEADGATVRTVCLVENLDGIKKTVSLLSGSECACDIKDMLFMSELTLVYQKDLFRSMVFVRENRLLPLAGA